MTLNGVGSYVQTADEFVAHWTDVDADRVANSLPELTLQGGYSLADFQTDRDEVETAISGTEGLENGRELAVGNRDSQKELLRDRMSQFRAAVELHLKSTPYLRATPTLPPVGISESKFLRPFDDMEDLWGRIDADGGIAGFTPPLLLRAGYALADFSTDLAEMRTRYKAVTEAENDLTIGRRRRDALLPPLRERMNQYRSAIELEYGPGHPLFESLPDLYSAPGSTPGAVTANGVWDDVNGEGVITWTASSDPNFDHYDIRTTPGPTYDTENDFSIFTYDSATTEHRTQDGLLNPGDVASFKVYVVLTTANESGSNTVTITNPTP